MKQSEIDKEYLGQRLIERGFEVWFRYMFRVIEGKPFIMEEIHRGLFDVFDDIFNQNKIRININVPPRAGKTTLAKYFIVFCLTVNPRCNFIYTSFSQMLLNDIARDIANILENPIYKAMYKNRYDYKNEELNPVNDFWREYLYKNEGKNVYSSKKIVTSQGGVVLFASTGSTITGFGVGIRGAKDFSGALICFPYDELVLTEKGYRKIGEIVENKEDIKVWSYNFDKERPELKRIERYIKNTTTTKQCFVEVKLNNGKSFICTDNHKVWTKNRGYVEAKDLTSIDCVVTFPNPFYLMDTKIKNFCNFLSRNVLISDFSQNIRRKFNLFSRHIVNFFNKIFETFPRFNCLNSSGMTIKSNSNFFQTSFCLSNFFNIFLRKFRTRKNQSAKVNSILHVFRFSAISQIFKAIVGWIAIKMSNLYFFLLHPNKCPQNKLMNTNGKGFIIFSKINDLITFSIRRVKSLFFEFNNSSFISASCKYISRAAYNISKIRNSIKSLIARDVFVNDVSVICHSHTSYCLTVYKNHNLYVGKCQVLVSNCDDGNKPADIRSEVMRENVLRYYEETLLSRLNNPNAAIINIQQRLHLEDLSGYLITKYNFETLKKPLIVNGKCTIPLQYTDERLRELQLNSFMFSAQYQQEPIPLGGNMIKSEWFNYYSTHPEYKRIFITGDTAQKTKECNDFSVFCVWGQFETKLYLIDMLRGKWEAPELLQQCKGLVNRYRIFNQKRLSEILLEDKASGTGLIQTLKRECTIPIRPIQVDKDKVTRVDDSLPYIANGYLYLPFSKEYNAELIKECELFSRDMSHKHDDIVDNITMAIQFISKRRSIYDVLGC